MPSWNVLFDSVQPVNAIENQKKSILKIWLVILKEIALYTSLVGNKK